MKTFHLKRASAAAASAVLLGTLGTFPAGTANAAPAAVCTMMIESITSGGDAAYTSITASAPPTAKYQTDRHLFTPGAARLSSTWRWDAGPTNAYVVLGSTLYLASYGDDEQTGEPYQYLNRVGGGWDKFTMFEQSVWGGQPAARSARYGLRNDGVLFRWTSWSKVHSYTGFAAVKAMTLISETKTYDTFLATTRGGALYTIRIPAATTQKPIVTKVRASTWQGFETLIAQRCGNQSTLLTAIDKDTGSAHLYAVGHANGTSTVIQSLGKLPGTFRDPVQSLWTRDDSPLLFGE